MSSRRFVIVDRDGTIIVKHPYLSDHRLVELLPGAAEGLRAMRTLGLGLVVVTNQSGIGRGYFSVGELTLVHNRMQQLLSKSDVSIDGIFYCPHRPEEECGCRKPATRLVDRAAAALGFDASEGFVVGDNICDMELGHRLKAKTFLVRTGYGAQLEVEEEVTADFVVDNLLEASSVIGDTLGRRVK